MLSTGFPQNIFFPHLFTHTPELIKFMFLWMTKRSLSTWWKFRAKVKISAMIYPWFLFREQTNPPHTLNVMLQTHVLYELLNMYIFWQARHFILKAPDQEIRVTCDEKSRQNRYLMYFIPFVLNLVSGWWWALESFGSQWNFWKNCHQSQKIIRTLMFFFVLDRYN